MSSNGTTIRFARTNGTDRTQGDAPAGYRAAASPRNLLGRGANASVPVTFVPHPLSVGALRATAGAAPGASRVAGALTGEPSRKSRLASGAPRREAASRTLK